MGNEQSELYYTSGYAPRKFFGHLRLGWRYAPSKSLKTFPGPLISYTVKENHISEILRYRPKKLTPLYNRIAGVLLPSEREKIPMRYP